MYCITQFGSIGTLYSAPDDERVIRSKHVEKKPWNKKNIRIVHIVGHPHMQYDARYIQRQQ